MDILQDYAYQAYRTYNDLSPHLRPLISFLHQARAQATSYALPLLHQLAILTQESPAIVSIGVLFLILLVSIRILNFLRRLVMWWTRLVLNIMFLGVIGLVVTVVLQRGLGRTAGDMVAWGRELNTVWWREYERWEGYQNQNRMGAGNVRSSRSGWR